MFITVVARIEVADLMEARQKFEVIAAAVPEAWPAKLTCSASIPIVIEEEPAG